MGISTSLDANGKKVCGGTAMPKLDLDTIPQTNTTGYPAPYDAPVQGRWYRRLAPPTGLSDFAASPVVLQPGAWSARKSVVSGRGVSVRVEFGGRRRIKTKKKQKT